MASGGSSSDWTKFVTINPPMAVIFKESKEDGKATSSLDIINKNKNEYVLFKVKTTDPNNYIVRPNQGVISPEATINVKIVCQQNIVQGGQQILNDKFLVQLSQTNVASANLNVDELNNLWKTVKKEQMVQYKMRVDIAGQSKLAASTTSTKTGQQFDSSNLEKSGTGISRMYTTVNQTQQESSKEPEPQSNQEYTTKAGGDPYVEYDELYRKFREAENQRDEAQRELQRLRDQKDLARMKNESLGGGASSQGKGSSEQKASGFSLTGLLLIAVAFILMGALLGKYNSHGTKIPFPV